MADDSIASRERTHRMRRELLGELPQPQFRHAVKDLVVIASASRSGSSLLAELLRSSRSLAHLRAELNPFLRWSGAAFPQSGFDSDALDETVPEAILDAVGEDLAIDCGRPTDDLSTESQKWQFSIDVFCRLAMQWPSLELEPNDIAAIVKRCLGTLEAEHGWSPGRFASAGQFSALLLDELRRIHPRIDPSAYDLDRSFLTQKNAIASGPPEADGPIIEERPFIPFRPWEPLAPSQIASTPLVVKTPSNAYRLRFLERLFPNATLHIVHLTRNPRGSINGLYDGWLHEGFYSHALSIPLAIAGYSDRFPAWGRRWWKFDLPPGWREFTSAPLEKVCLFQWASANAAILDHVANRSSPRLRSRLVRFESILESPARRDVVLAELLAWIGAQSDERFTAMLAGPMPVVMATRAPEPERWRRRADLIEPLCNTSEVRSLSQALGYSGE